MPTLSSQSSRSKPPKWRGRGRLARAHASNLASRAAAALIVACPSVVTEYDVLVKRTPAGYPCCKRSILLGQPLRALPLSTIEQY